MRTKNKTNQTIKIQSKGYEELSNTLRAIKSDYKNLQNFISNIENECIKNIVQVVGLAYIVFNENSHLIIFTSNFDYEQKQGEYSYTITGHYDGFPSWSDNIYTASIFMHPESSEYPYKRLEICDNYVFDKTMRGNGIGSAGINIIKGIAKQHNCKIIFGDRIPKENTPEEQEKLWNFYNKNGFAQWKDKNYIEYDMGNYKSK